MGIANVLQLEKDNTGIILHKEGLFWRAYEISAYLFVKNIKQYSVKKKYYKNVNKEIVYLGFPQISLNNVLQIIESKNIEKSEKQIIINGFNFELNNFEKWKDNIVIVEKRKDLTGFENLSGLDNMLAEKIRNFRVINKTPIECQQFIIELQSELSP